MTSTSGGTHPYITDTESTNNTLQGDKNYCHFVPVCMAGIMLRVHIIATVARDDR